MYGVSKEGIKNMEKESNNKQKEHKVLSWLKEECKDWRTFVIFIIVLVIMYAPVWLGYLLYYILGLKWCMVIATIALTFWAGPFTPFFPIAIAVTLFIKKIIKNKVKKKGE